MIFDESDRFFLVATLFVFDSVSIDGDRDRFEGLLFTVRFSCDSTVVNIED